MKLMAEGWYRSIAGEAAREEIIARMHARDYDHEAMMRDHLARRRDE